MSKIEQLISEIEMYIDTCKSQAFSGNKKIVVEKDVIEEMLVELRMQTPDEIKRYQKIISNKDAILADAKAQSDRIINDANRQTEQIVSEHEITRQAHAEAERILSEAQMQARAIIDAANNDSAQIRQGAIDYTDNELAILQNLLSGAAENTEGRYNAFMKQLNDSLAVVSQNRSQLQAAKQSMGAPANED